MVKKINGRYVILIVLLAVAEILVYSYGLDHLKRQKTTWMGPYLSAAANLDWPPAFQIDEKQLAEFNKLDDSRLEDSFKFSKSITTTHYSYNDIGYVYLIWFAKRLFPFVGDQSAIIILQGLIHLLLCSFLATSKLLPAKWRVGFFLLYALNPFILRFVVFNHYYFWQSVPSILLIYLCVIKKDIEKSSILPIVFMIFLVPWSILARPSALLILLVLFYFIYQKIGKFVFIISGIYFISILWLLGVPSQKNIWHTAYIGVGAYQNPYHVQLSDDEGSRLFKKITGEEISTSAGGNIYSKEVFDRYKLLTKESTLIQLRDTPFLYIKNAIVNTMLAFGTGYFTGAGDILNYILSIIGLSVLILFYKYKLWSHILAIGCMSLVFTLYYPPVPAYTFGNYALIVSGILTILYTKPTPSTILYLSFNDGSDMRINKEIQTLAPVSNIDFLGIGTDRTVCYVSEKPIKNLHWVNGNRKSFSAKIRYFATAIRLLISKRYYSVHVINEPQLLLLWPFLFLQNHVIIDIFDSLFLRSNKPGNQLNFIKRLTYLPADDYIVTDINRLGLLPDFMKNKAFVLPNYPNKWAEVAKQKTHDEKLSIMYFGWLGAKRGTETVLAILNTNLPVRVIMAGWVADQLSEQLTRHEKVTWLGTLEQHEALDVASKVDYILCVYAPVNQNNVNASPNKIYDAIQLQVPVIINAEVTISDFVRRHHLGYVLNKYELENWNVAVNNLIRLKGTYQFSEEMIETYTWENVSNELTRAHRL